MEKMIALGLTLVLVLPAVVTSEKDVRMCDNLVPGLKRLSRGVDITSLDLMPLSFGGSNGYRQPLLDYDCSGGRKITINGVSTFA